MTPAPISVERLPAKWRGEKDGSLTPWASNYNGALEACAKDLERALPALLHQLADAEAQLEDARWQLAYCFQQAGADTDGHFGPHLAPRALQAVTELRRDYDEACSAEHPAPFSVRHFKRKAEAAERAREECVALVRRIVNDQSWRTNDNKLWPDLIAFLAASGGKDNA